MAKINKDFSFPNKSNKLYSLLKNALIYYKQTKDLNIDMVEYTINSFAERIDDNKLFLSYIIWLLLKWFPADH